MIGVYRGTPVSGGSLYVYWAIFIIHKYMCRPLHTMMGVTVLGKRLCVIWQHLLLCRVNHDNSFVPPAVQAPHLALLFYDEILLHLKCSPQRLFYWFGLLLGGTVYCPPLEYVQMFSCLPGFMLFAKQVLWYPCIQVYIVIGNWRKDLWICSFLVNYWSLVHCSNAAFLTACLAANLKDVSLAGKCNWNL